MPTTPRSHVDACRSEPTTNSRRPGVQLLTNLCHGRPTAVEIHGSSKRRFVPGIPSRNPTSSKMTHHRGSVDTEPPGKLLHWHAVPVQPNEFVDPCRSQWAGRPGGRPWGRRTIPGVAQLPRVRDGFRDQSHNSHHLEMSADKASERSGALQRFRPLPGVYRPLPAMRRWVADRIRRYHL